MNPFPLPFSSSRDTEGRRESAVKQEEEEEDAKIKTRWSHQEQLQGETQEKQSVQID